MTELDLTPLHPALSELAPQGRSALLPALQAAQSIYGYLPEAVAAEVGRALNVPLADVYGVIDFYTMLYLEPVGRQILRVCGDPACALAGSEAVLQAACEHLGLSLDEVSPDGEYTVERVPCLGLCEHAPAALLGDTPLGELDPADFSNIFAGEIEPLKPVIGGDLRILTARCGEDGPARLEDYLSGGGYAGLKKALAMSPAEVIAEVRAAWLVGRGGAAFPTCVKWEGTAQAPGEPKYVVCNADESEPGTFKDRALMQGDPHAILEGMAIAAYATGARYGYLYIRGEFPFIYPVMAGALEEARQGGYLGEDILGSGFDFDIELRMGSGAYICGEETALLESIEGKRGFPRIRPPYPTTNGLFNRPTVINNVETLCNVPYILARGAGEYLKLGTQRSTGPKLFCVSGDVDRPGLYEVPFGVTLRHLIYDLAGGMASGDELGAVLIGGAAGAFATQDDLDVRLTFEDLSAAGLPLGSGAVTVFDASRDLRQVLAGLGRFFAHESCGKCYPCQLGTQRQLEILTRIAQGKALPGDAARLGDVGWTMTDASLCGLGQTAASAVLSAMRIWPELFA